MDSYAIHFFIVTRSLFMEGKTISDLFINEQIRDKEVRVIGMDGEQLGIMSAKEALALAEEAGVDLVKIAPTAKPPVCKIIDYGKYRYELARKEKMLRRSRRLLRSRRLDCLPISIRTILIQRSMLLRSF